MMPASKATEARTMPGPPRALVVMARLTRSRPRKPAASGEVELEADEGEVGGDEEGEGDFADGVERVGEELAFFVDDREAGEEGGEDHADVEGAGEDAVGKKDGEDVGDGGVDRDDVEA
jgi:hypothetical protein